MEWRPTIEDSGRHWGVRVDGGGGCGVCKCSLSAVVSDLQPGVLLFHCGKMCTSVLHASSVCCTILCSVLVLHASSVRCPILCSVLVLHASSVRCPILCSIFLSVQAMPTIATAFQSWLATSASRRTTQNTSCQNYPHH